MTDFSSKLSPLYRPQHHLRALPERFGNWNSVWKRFDRLGKAGAFEDYFAMLAGLSDTAHLV